MSIKPWYSLKTRNVDPAKGEATCGAGTDAVSGHEPYCIRLRLYVTTFGKRIILHLSTMGVSIVFIGLLFLALWAALPKPLMEPGGEVFDPLVDWFLSSLIGGSFCHFCRVPAQVGIYWASIIWANIPTFGHLAGNILVEIRKIASRVGLTVIVSRAGFSVQLPELKARWKSVSYLSLVPMVLEAVVHGFFAQYTFDYPDYRWAFLQGFLVSAIAPGIVVPALFALREEGYGHSGPPPIMFPACVLDCVVAIWMINFLADLIFSDFPLGLAIALGPIQLIVGFGIGVFMGFVFHYLIRIFLAEEPASEDTSKGENAFSYPTTHQGAVYQKIVWLFTAFAISLLFVGDRVGLAGGGAIAVMGLAMTVSALWAPKKHKEGPFSPSVRSPQLMSSPHALSPSSIEMGSPDAQTSPIFDEAEVEKKQRERCQHDFFVRHRTLLFQEYAWLWENLVMTSLFAFAGATVDLTEIFSGEFLGKAIGPLFVGVFVRFVFALPAGFGQDYTWGEIFFIGFSWFGKVPVQAALGALALEKATSLASEGKMPSDDTWQAANNVRNNAMLSAAIFAPASAVLTMVLGRVWLKKKDST